ncbi:glycosyltransferase family 2 protein [Goekera deserti]|uniref:glycosyltransferase family 2 protein n=1 Tax=Goekera deserti TaxID=2497753 RepID=UPI001F3C7D2C|nr:glycosyltransferase [Goekera deserti]
MPQWDDVELVVVAYRSRAQVEAMLAGLPANLPVAVVDNSDGADGLGALVTARPHGRYLSGGGVGFARAANLGARTSTASVVVFVKPSARPTTADLATLVEDVVTDPGCSASAAVLTDPEGRSQRGVGGWEPSPRRALVHAVGLHKLWPHAGIYARPPIGVPLEVDWVNGGVMAVRRETFLELGCFDEGFHVFNEDMAFGWASRQHGLRQRLRTDVAVPSAVGGSGGPALDLWRLRGASMARYLDRYHPGRRVGNEVAVVVLALGSLARAAVQTLRRDGDEARASRVYARGLLTRRAYMEGRLVSRR